MGQRVCERSRTSPVSLPALMLLRHLVVRSSAHEVRLWPRNSGEKASSELAWFLFLTPFECHKCLVRPRHGFNAQSQSRPRMGKVLLASCYISLSSSYAVSFGADPWLNGEAAYETIVGIQSVGVVRQSNFLTFVQLNNSFHLIASLCKAFHGQHPGKTNSL
jgi:hypothetical protein